MILIRPRVIVAIAIAIAVFTSSVCVLSGLRSAPESFVPGSGYVISSSSAPTVFSSQVDMDLVYALESMDNITGVSPEIFAFSSFNGVAFVVRGVDIEKLNSTGPRFLSYSIEEGSSMFSPSGVLLGTHLANHLNLGIGDTLPLVSSYSSRIEFLKVIGVFRTDSPLDDEALVSLDVARYLSGLPAGTVSIIRVTTSQAEWLSNLLSPERARFTLFDLVPSKVVAGPGEPIDLDVKVRNWGASSGSGLVTFRDGTKVLAEELVSLNASSSSNITERMEFEDLGVHTLEASISGDFPVKLSVKVTVVEPYLVLSAPSRVLVGDAFSVKVTTYSSAVVAGAQVSFDDQLLETDSQGSASFSASSTGTFTVTASCSGFANVSHELAVVNPSVYPDSFLPVVTSFTISPQTINETENATGIAVLENQGSVGGTFDMVVLLDSSTFRTIPLDLGPAQSKSVTILLDDLAVGTHVVQVGSFSNELVVQSWIANDQDLIELVLRYGGTTKFSPASAIPIYQAAKISEGNIAVALFAMGAVAAVLASLSIVSVFSKEIRESKRKLGILKTIGASSSNIRRLVLPQALENSLAGGAIGLAFGYAISDGLSRSGIFMLFGHTLIFTIDGAILVVVLLGAIAISVITAVVSSEIAVRETVISSIRRLPEDRGPSPDLESILEDG